MSKDLNVKIIKGSQLQIDDRVFVPFKTKTHLDIILSHDGGLMPATNIVISGGPGSGKSTIVMDMLSSLTNQKHKCLFVSAEMDEIAYYKYCKRIPKFGNIDTLFLKHHSDNPKPVIEKVFEQGWDVIAIDSLAEVLGMIKDAYGGTETTAERWFLEYQDQIKLTKLTSFINIQQMTKAGQFSGSNRMKHMTDAMALIKRADPDSSERVIQFDKNRDGDVSQKVYFTISNDHVTYNFETE